MKHATLVSWAARAAGALLLSTAPAWAHEGHGMPGLSHWHNSDTFGFVAIAVVMGLAAWFSKGDQ